MSSAETYRHNNAPNPEASRLGEYPQTPAAQTVAQTVDEPVTPTAISAEAAGTNAGVSGATDPKLTEKALEHYNRGVEFFKIAQSQGNKGDAKAQQRVLKEAVTHFEKALAIRPNFVEAQSNIGFCYLTLKKNKLAIDSFQKALVIQPKHLSSLNGLATTYALNEQIPMSIQTFQELTTLAPSQPDYLFNLGSVLQKASRYNEAEQAYMDALKAKPTHQRTLFNLGTLKENQNQFEAALGFYEKAKGSDIGNPIGLEAMKRISVIQQALNPAQSPPEPVSKKN